MNLIDAIKSERPFRRKGETGDWNPNRNDTARWSVTKESLLADDWEIQEPTATITKRQLYDAYSAVLKENNELSYWARLDIIQGIALNLGLED